MLEKLAAFAHRQWSGWMEYLFRFGTENSDGSFTMDAVYTDLPESEKTSDRTEAKKVLSIMRQGSVHSASDE